MFYSSKYNLLYIASPKSGSVTVHDILERIDPDGERRSITVNNKKVTSKDMEYGVIGHARSWEIKEALGPKTYDNIRTIGFVRHPFDKLVSSYFYNKKQNLIKVFNTRGNKNRYLRILRRFITSLAPKILPFQVWALLFPMKTSFEYFHDKEGNRIVLYLGRTDHLQKDILNIFSALDIDFKGSVPHYNKSKHSKWENYITNVFIRTYLRKRYKRDICLYELVEVEQQNL